MSPDMVPDVGACATEREPWARQKGGDGIQLLHHALAGQLLKIVDIRSRHQKQSIFGRPLGEFCELKIFVLVVHGYFDLLCSICGKVATLL